MLVPCLCHACAMLVPCLCHACAMLVQCLCRVAAVVRGLWTLVRIPTSRDRDSLYLLWLYLL